MRPARWSSCAARTIRRRVGGDAPPDGRKVQATLHWVAAADAVTAEVRLYNRICSRVPTPGADGDIMADINPGLAGGAARLSAWSRALATAPSGEAVQFERLGISASIWIRAGRLVFNRTVGLRDTWAKVQAGSSPLPRRGGG